MDHHWETQLLPSDRCRSNLSHQQQTFSTIFCSFSLCLNNFYLNPLMKGKSQIKEEDPPPPPPHHQQSTNMYHHWETRLLPSDMCRSNLSHQQQTFSTIFCSFSLCLNNFYLNPLMKGKSQIKEEDPPPPPPHHQQSTNMYHHWETRLLPSDMCRSIPSTTNVFHHLLFFHSLFDNFHNNRPLGFIIHRVLKYNWRDKQWSSNGWNKEDTFGVAWGCWWARILWKWK